MRLFPKTSRVAIHRVTSGGGNPQIPHCHTVQPLLFSFLFFSPLFSSFSFPFPFHSFSLLFLPSPFSFLFHIPLFSVLLYFLVVSSLLISSFLIYNLFSSRPFSCPSLLVSLPLSSSFVLLVYSFFYSHPFFFLFRLL